MIHSSNNKISNIVLTVFLVLLSSCRLIGTLKPIPSISATLSNTSTVIPTLPEPKPSHTPILESYSKSANTKTFPKSDIELPQPPTLKPTKLPIPTKTPEPTDEKTLDFELPPECSNFDPKIGPEFYSDLSNGACDNPALSSDGKYIAYGYWAVHNNEDGSERIVPEARLFSTILSTSTLIYLPKCNFIYPEWTSSGNLVISENAQDVGCEQTVVYDVKKNEIIAKLLGSVRKMENGWSPDKNAFFTISPINFGPVCAETLSGFDLITSNTIPVIKPITPVTNIYKVIDLPIWTANSKNLFVMIRDGICSNEENYDCTYSSSYIVVINFSGAHPTISNHYYDPSTDYSITKSEDGSVKITTAPSKTVSCWDIHLEERR